MSLAPTTGLLDSHPTSELIVPVSGDFTVEDLIEADFERCAELLATFGDLHLGFVDASVVAVALVFESSAETSRDRPLEGNHLIKLAHGTTPSAFRGARSRDG